jgi:hypothetical protein
MTNGTLGMLDEPYVHLAFSKGLDDWLEKHNRYSSLEALRVYEGSCERWPVLWLITRDPVRRRRAWKEFAYHLPLRPLARCFATLFIRGGILEGRAGWNYARLIALYDEMITLKLRLLRAQAAAVADRR